MIKEVDTNAHSVFLINYYLVLVIKNRKPIFNDFISNRAKEIFEKIALKYKIEVVEWVYEKDHVCISFKAQPKSEISKFINAYKSASSRLLKKEFPEIKEFLWQGKFWSQSFCLLSTGSEMPDVVENFIQSQGE